VQLGLSAIAELLVSFTPRRSWAGAGGFSFFNFLRCCLFHRARDAVFQWMKLKENVEMIQSETFMMKSSNRSDGSK